MKMRLLQKGLKLDQRTISYIEKKISRLGKYFRSNKKDAEFAPEVEIELDKKGKFRAEVNLITSYKRYRAEAVSISVEGSIDEVYEALENQILKDKDKLATLRKRGAMSIKKKMVIDENARF